MLSKTQEKLIKSLHNNKGRVKAGLWLVEGTKFLKLAGSSVRLKFSPNDSKDFAKLTTTETPPTEAGLVIPPQFQLADVVSKKTVLLLDNIQDPGNLGTIIRLAGAFDAGLILCDCVDPGNSKVIRSSAGLVFKSAWIEMNKSTVINWLSTINWPVYRLENNESAQKLDLIANDFSVNQLVLIIGSEGQGITLPINAQSIAIKHNPLIDSINVAAAVAITLFVRYQKIYE